MIEHVSFEFLQTSCFSPICGEWIFKSRSSITITIVFRGGGRALVRAVRTSVTAAGDHLDGVVIDLATGAITRKRLLSLVETLVSRRKLESAARSSKFELVH